jgi:hypothetical protein
VVRVPYVTTRSAGRIRERRVPRRDVHADFDVVDEVDRDEAIDEAAAVRAHDRFPPPLAVANAETGNDDPRDDHDDEDQEPDHHVA